MNKSHSESAAGGPATFGAALCAAKGLGAGGLFGSATLGMKSGDTKLEGGGISFFFSADEHLATFGALAFGCRADLAVARRSGRQQLDLNSVNSAKGRCQIQMSSSASSLWEGVTDRAVSVYSESAAGGAAATCGGPFTWEIRLLGENKDKISN